MTLSLAISPCPNDTFVFHALVHGHVPDAPPVEVTYADVDVTNTAAQRGAYDLVKVSYAAVPHAAAEYTLLPCGGALGHGCGPLLVTRADRAGDPDGDPKAAQGAGADLDLADATVAVPGELTTAYLLFQGWAGDRQPARLVTVPFAEIMPAVAAGRYDAGLVIHEARFTYPEYGLRAPVDLGAWWEGETGLPIPLGAILARRDRVDPQQAAQWLRTSVRHAWADPAATREYVRAHAQEMAPDVAQQHIELYVNAYTEDLGAHGRAAVDTLLQYAETRGTTGSRGS